MNLEVNVKDTQSSVYQQFGITTTRFALGHNRHNTEYDYDNSVDRTIFHVPSFNTTTALVVLLVSTHSFSGRTLGRIVSLKYIAYDSCQV